MDTNIEERMRDIREVVRGITSRFDRTYMRKCIDSQSFPDELWKALGEAGLLGITIPEEHGGSGGGMVELVALSEALSSNGLVLLFLVTTGLGRVPIVKYGTPEQIEKFVTPTLDGSIKMSFAITESNAGTNSFNMTTMAKRDGDGFVLNGEKCFISGAADSDLMLVVSRTKAAKDVERRTDGMSLFVVDTKSAGITMSPLNIDVGTAEKQYIVHFDNVRLPADALIGPEHGGLGLMFAGLNAERLIAASGAIGTADYALGKAVSYANERKPFGVPIGSYQALQHRMAEIKAEIEAARLLTYHAAAAFDAGKKDGAEANMAKLLASRLAVRAVDVAIQTHGGNGFDRDYDVITLWAGARLNEVAPINNEMLLNFIGEHVLGLPKSY